MGEKGRRGEGGGVVDRLPLHPLEKGIFSIDSPPALGNFEEEGEGRE